MKHRITYLLHEGEPGTDPSTIQVTHDSISSGLTRAASEWRVTVGLLDLPNELQQVLKQSHELHVRWSSTENYEAVSPFVSRLPPGLHVFFTPRSDAIKDYLCPMIHKIFSEDLKCESVKDTFTRPQIIEGSERFAAQASFQYFAPLQDLTKMSSYIRSIVCNQKDIHCPPDAFDLSDFSYLDLDYDTLTHALTITGFSPSVGENGISASRSAPDRVEVGILNNEKPDEPEELKLGGFLTIIGEDTSPSATLFSFPSRHHALPTSHKTTYKTSFRHPTGLHPVLQLVLRSEETLTPPAPNCALHAYLTLPSSLFVDKYQFNDGLFLESNNLRSLRALSGETDLEAPDWVVGKWGSAALFELSLPGETAHSTETGVWDVSIPLHLRYLAPNGTSTTSERAESISPSEKEIQIPHPVLFFACPAEEGLKMSTNPFDRVNLGYDGLFGPKTLFYHVPSGDRELVAEIEVPVLSVSEQGARWVEYGTGLAVLAGFVWVLWMLFRPVKAGTKEGKEKKKE
ncbi:hypothetical protein MBLNU457_g0808t1 [Dothideomycetes sp. NU457]